METLDKSIITVENTINSPVEKVWEYWTKPEHITRWNNASEDWHTPHAENDLRVGGNFLSRMESRDGTMGFDFGGVYDVITNNEYIEYTIGDGRKVKITFSPHGNGTKVVESFEAEATNSIEMQQGGWQAILDNFKKYTEATHPGNQKTA
ncbi:MAG: SRPBCC family protein [Ferruginibacter sp.]